MNVQKFSTLRANNTTLVYTLYLPEKDWEAHTMQQCPLQDERTYMYFHNNCVNRTILALLGDCVGGKEGDCD